MDTRDKDNESGADRSKGDDTKHYIQWGDQKIPVNLTQKRAWDKFWDLVFELSSRL